MARVTFIKKARQRYEMVPVLDAEGKQVISPVKNLRTGEAKKTKHGREVTMKQTIADKTKPLPPLTCDYPNCPVEGKVIAVGTAYKHITPRSGPYGGRQRNRHADCPTWQVWEYSYSTGARVAQVQNDIHAMIEGYELTVEDDFDDMRDEAAGMAGELRDEKEDTVSNMPEQLQDGSQAQEQFEALEQWVDEIESADAPDMEDHEEECGTCDGSGKVENPDYDAEMAEGGENEEEGYEEEEEIDCEDCDGTGKDTSEGSVSEDWIEAAKDALREAVDGCEI